MTQTPQTRPILVTGATGRLGCSLRAAWQLEAPCDIAPVFTSRGGGADLVLAGDGALPDLPRAEAVLALWGETSNDTARLGRNIALAHRSRAVARACGARLVLHLSSAAVYGPGAALSEATRPAPVTAYGRSKLAMEQLVATFDMDTARHVCLRLANVVGADSLAPALASADAPVLLDRFPDGHGPERAYIAPGCLARVIAALVAAPATDLPALLNIAAPAPVSMQDLACATQKPITWRPAPDGAVQVVTLDTTRLRHLLPALRLHKSAAGMIADWQRLRGAQ